MTRKSLPQNWDENRVQQVLAHYETQTEDEAVAEDESSFEDHAQVVIEIPRDLLDYNKARPNRFADEFESRLAPIIFLNGASSAGKKSLGKALQDILDEPYLLLGLDTCFHMVPDRWAGGSNGPYRHLGFEYLELPAEDEHPLLGIGYGPIGWRMMDGFHRAVAELVRSKNPVIIDEMLLDGRVRDHWLQVLAPFATLYVGVHCDLDTLEQRELQRGNRPGLARWSRDRVHEGLQYDLWVDTTSQTPAACARQILDNFENYRPLST